VQAFKDVGQAWSQALKVLQTCDCEFGCPACTMVIFSSARMTFFLVIQTSKESSRIRISTHTDRLCCFPYLQSASETVNSESNSSKHAAIVLLEHLLCTRQQASVPALRHHSNAAPRIPHVQVQNPKFDVKPHVDPGSNSMMPAPSSKDGPYVSALKASSTSRWAT